MESGDLARALIGISSQVGEVKGLLQALDEKLSAHVRDDQGVAARVGVLENTAAQQVGTKRAYTTIATVISTLSGAVGGFLSGLFWHSR